MEQGNKTNLMVVNAILTMENQNIKQLKIFSDERGYLFETLRNDDAFFDGTFGQALVSVSKPGHIRAWHRHHKQTDYTTCVKGKILLLTAIEKNGKPEITRHVLDGKNPQLVKVPNGVWHGYTPLGDEDAMVFYIMDQTYNAKEPDEERKEWDAFGKECWEEQK
jgi:dTDP-4-dehydrorhamnose 3,5-epimerase